MSPFDKPLGLQQPTRACVRRLSYPSRSLKLYIGSRRVCGAWRCRSATGDVVGQPAQTNGTDEPHPDNDKDKSSTPAASTVTVDVEHVHVPPPASSTSAPVSPGAAPDTADWIASHPVDWDGKPDTGVKEPDASGALPAVDLSLALSPAVGSCSARERTPTPRNRLGAPGGFIAAEV